MGMMRNLGLGLGGAGLVAALVWALWPVPLAVDLAPVTRGPMQGVILAQGVTRVRTPYAITAPFTGMAIRSPVEVGDAVVAGQTVVAVIQPADPALLDARSRTQAEAAVVEAQAAVALAESNLRQAETALTHADQELQRSRALAASGTIPRRMLEDVESARLMAEQALAASRSQLDFNRATLARAQAQLIGPQPQPDPAAEAGRMLCAPAGTANRDRAGPDRTQRAAGAGRQPPADHRRS
jgi:HlyD family secretion protein